MTRDIIARTNLARQGLLAALLLAAGSPAALATTILNGGFDSGLASWTVDFSSVTGDGGFGLLEDGTGDGQRTLSQSFTVSPGGETLSFDFSFSTGGGTDPDQFQASVLSNDSVDFVDIIVVDDVFGPFTSAGATYTAGGAIPGFVEFVGGTSYSGHVTVPLPAAITGKAVTLYFDLYDNDLASTPNTRAAIDNVVVTARGVPEPGVLLLLTGLLMVPSRRVMKHA